MSSKSIWTLSLTLVLAMTLALGCSKSPLGSTRSDSEVAADVQNKINGDSNIPTKQVTVNSTAGTVTLSGTVGSETERLAAANDAAQVDGVKTVVNNLQVGAGTTAMNQPMASNTQAGNVRTPTRNTRTTTTTSGGSRGTTTSPASETQVTIPAGTQLSIRTIDEVDSEKAEPGNTFAATLDSPVFVGDTSAIPANADVQGRVVEVKSAGKFAGQSELILQLTRVSYNGHSYQLNTNQWSKTGSSRGKNTAAKVGGGAALGAIIGGIAGGGKGAAIGAGVGAGAGTGVQAMTKGQQIVLRPETLLTFTLQSPVSVVASSANRSPNRTRMTPTNNN